jgi:hypothetical protein
VEGGSSYLLKIQTNPPTLFTQSVRRTSGPVHRIEVAVDVPLITTVPWHLPVLLRGSPTIVAVPEKRVLFPLPDRLPLTSPCISQPADVNTHVPRADPLPWVNVIEMLLKYRTPEI